MKTTPPVNNEDIEVGSYVGFNLTNGTYLEGTVTQKFLKFAHVIVKEESVELDGDYAPDYKNMTEVIYGPDDNPYLRDS